MTNDLQGLRSTPRILKSALHSLFWYMTLYQFRCLSENDQALAVWEGEYLFSREEVEHTMMLYKLHNFYVEVFYHNQSNTVVRFNTFNSKKQLNLYFGVQLN